jgi:hypothetical protein
MSALGAIEVAEFDEVGDQPAAPLRLVTAPADGVRPPDIAGLAGVSRRVPSSPRMAGRSALVTSGAPALQSRPAPLRLTRRGRMVVVILAAALATVAITAASMAFSGAQATNHGRPGAGYAGMHQIVVQPGQTLWSIAAQAEPSADPRQVIQEILTANSMTGSAVQAGQLLWVPK